MGYTKDQWTRPVEQDGKTVREPNARYGKGKRWLACWTAPDGTATTKAFAKKIDADNHWKAQETDVTRGQYIDRKAGRVRLDVLAQRWLRAKRVGVDPNTAIKYETSYRMHVAPTFAPKSVGAITPQDISDWIADLKDAGLSTSAITSSLMVLGGIFDVAVAQKLITANPARDKTITRPKNDTERIHAWSPEIVARIIDAHPVLFRVLALVAAATGLRQGELFGLAAEDIDFDEQVIHVRRQVKRLRGGIYVFALPKSNKERDVPMSGGLAQLLRVFMAANPPRAYTLPWETADGAERTVRLLFRWTNGEHIRATTYNYSVWNPALVAVGLIAPMRREGGRRIPPQTDSKFGMHALRHYYASITLAQGQVSINELAEFLGHKDPGFTLRVYGHMQPSSHERARKAVDEALFRLRSVSDGAVTEQGPDRVD